MLREFKTIRKGAEAEYIEKKSRFLAAAKPVSSEEEALAFIQERKSTYWDATHNVYAYSISGDGSLIQRYSDDGEPQGTAGIPVLEVLRKQNLTNLVVVVTRYFGGTLLGAGGLVRAYGKAAGMAVEKALVVTKKLCKKIDVAVDYSVSAKLQNSLLTNGYIIDNILYLQNVTFQVVVPPEEMEGLVTLVQDIASGTARIIEGEKCYIMLDGSGKLVAVEDYGI